MSEIEEEAILVPASWFERVEARIAALEERLPAMGRVREAIEERLSALEEELPVTWSEEKQKRLNDCFMDSCKRTWFSQVPEEPPPARYGLWAGENVVLLNHEIEGLDKDGFRELVRERLNNVYGQWMKEWERRREGAPGENGG
jgi:hypothetical protein